MLIRLKEQDAEDELGSMSGSDTDDDDGDDTTGLGLGLGLGLYDEQDHYVEHHQLEGKDRYF
jgi:hypothetical protein